LQKFDTVFFETQCTCLVSKYALVYRSIPCFFYILSVVSKVLKQ